MSDLESRNRAAMSHAERMWLDPPDEADSAECPICGGETDNTITHDNFDRDEETGKISGRSWEVSSDCDKCVEAYEFCINNDSAIFLKDHNAKIGKLKKAIALGIETLLAAQRSQIDTFIALNGDPGVVAYALINNWDIPALVETASQMRDK